MDEVGWPPATFLVGRYLRAYQTTGTEIYATIKLLLTLLAGQIYLFLAERNPRRINVESASSVLEDILGDRSVQGLASKHHWLVCRL